MNSFIEAELKNTGQVHSHSVSSTATIEKKLTPISFENTDQYILTDEEKKKRYAWYSLNTVSVVILFL
jgi:hypothetical protein